MAYRKSLDFLPSVFQTKTNDKILKSSVDQLISEPEIRELDGYIGRRFNPALSPVDSYIQEDYRDRQQPKLSNNFLAGAKNFPAPVSILNLLILSFFASSIRCLITFSPLPLPLNLSCTLIDLNSP